MSDLGWRWNEMQWRRIDFLRDHRKRGMKAHREYYGWLVETLGSSQLAHLLPEQRPNVLRESLAKDEHLNNIPLKLWDSKDWEVRRLAKKAGINNWSLADTVCVLKERARLLAEE